MLNVRRHASSGMTNDMKMRVAIVAVVVLFAAALLWMRPTEVPRERVEDNTSTTNVGARGSKHDGSSRDETTLPKIETRRKTTAHERARYLREIRESVARRAQTASSEPQAEPPTRSEREREPADTEDTLTDRSGGVLTTLLRDLHRDVMPLADECYAQAVERDPTLAGGLDLQFQVVGDEDVGGLVESVDVMESSEIQDVEMIECMRETLLSTIFPAPDDSGSTGVQLTLRFEP
jgi:hypothetical protein